MIQRIEALHYRSLRFVAQDLAPFQLLVGPNGAGKSNLLDAIAFLGDLLNLGPVGAILGDRKRGVSPRVESPRHLCWMREGSRFELAVELEIPSGLRGKVCETFGRVRYEVAIDAAMNGDEVGIAGETLWLTPERAPHAPVQRQLFPAPPALPDTLLTARARPGWRRVVNKVRQSGTDYFTAETSGWNHPFTLGPTRSALANLPEDETKFPVAIWTKRVLTDGIHRIALNAEAMRRPSPPGAPKTYAPDGSNLPWVAEHLRENDEDRFARWLDHVRGVIPELKNIRTVDRPEDRHRYLVLQHGNGFEAPCWLVSDGTLRLLALTLLAYVPGVEGVYLIEEPENGIHPRAVETLHESLSSVFGAQLLCASHSPLLLGMAQPQEILCFAKDSAGATDVVRGSEHPRLKDWKGTVDLGQLHAAGVLG
ncbi:MAG: AAA family ATPase [Planctomycetes bacterium]|nr:AAA family ATPase [Planctomycetota bacterium]